jgi:hypothetical protein
MTRIDDLRSQPCPICKSLRYTWGKARANLLPVGFSYDHLLSGNDELLARRCNRCGNVQFFTNAKTLPRLKVRITQHRIEDYALYVFG